jgi:cholesterol oxidase
MSAQVCILEFIFDFICLVILMRLCAGVVNHKGQVFRGHNNATGVEVHDGLYICDGSIVPRSLGINPLHTISALSERNLDLLIADRKLRDWSVIDEETAKPELLKVPEGRRRLTAIPLRP